MAVKSTDDPRSIVTPDAFQVSRELLGLPLASPRRRLVAILLDLLLIAILSQLGGTALALAAAVFFFGLARRGRKSGPSWGGRILVGCLGVLFIAVAIPAVIGVVGFLNRSGGTPDPPDPPGEVSTMDFLGGLGDALLLRQSTSPGEAAPLVGGVVDRGRSAGMSDADLRELLTEVVPDSPWAPALLDSVLAAGGSEEGGEVEAPAPVEQEADTGLAVAGSDSLDALGARIQTVEQRNEALAEEVRDLRTQLRDEQEREEGFFLPFLQGIFEDLGLAFGFGTIYLTVFTAWGKGRTPGKRMLGIRVLRLDGKPITWWDAFERAGGYAAGFATGLLGFAQVLWDPNRQAIHDRISSTVVVRDGRGPVPGLWSRAVDTDPGRDVKYVFEQTEDR